MALLKSASIGFDTFDSDSLPESFPIDSLSFDSVGILRN